MWLETLTESVVVNKFANVDIPKEIRFTQILNKKIKIFIFTLKSQNLLRQVSQISILRTLHTYIFICVDICGIEISKKN